MTTALRPGTDELIALLAEEEQLYAELLAIGQQEQDAILGSDPAWLSSLVAQKERVMEHVARVETERQTWIAAWAAAAGAAATPTLNELARQVGPHDAERIGTVRDALLTRIRDLAEMNNRNSHLLNGALRIVNRSIEAYGRVGGERGYDPSGEPARTARTVVLDRRV